MTSESARLSWVRRILEELGIASLYGSSRDVKILCLQRLTRMYAYGVAALILVVFLEGLGISKTKIGLFMTLTLVGDVCISFFLTLFADGLGRKTILAIGALLMVGSGVAFAVFDEYWILLLAAILGVISPSGNEIGPFRAIEESIVAQLTTPDTRGDVYAWYSLMGQAGVALGMMTCGWVIQYLTISRQWGEIRAYRLMFCVYAALGLFKLLLALLLSHKAESEKKQLSRNPSSSGLSETSPLLSGNGAAESPEDAPKSSLRSWMSGLLPEIQRDRVGVVVQLCFIFGLDSFASGLVALSWITYYFETTFNIEKGALGSIFFTTSFIAAASMLVASSLAKRFGNVKTMVFTHIPSSIFLALLPVPRELPLALVFLFLRSSTQSMDTAPRAAFLATIILPGERTAVMGLINVVKTGAQSLAPFITGILAEKRVLWLTFVIGGSLKVAYDIGVLVLFETKERERIRAELSALQDTEGSGEAQDQDEHN